ncbi:MAG: hypothetical protein AAFZ09_08410, partial [Pseudomonadota bacterium]
MAHEGAGKGGADRRIGVHGRDRVHRAHRGGRDPAADGVVRAGARGIGPVGSQPVERGAERGLVSGRDRDLLQKRVRYAFIAREQALQRFGL